MKISPIISPKVCEKLFSSIIINDTQRKAQEKWLDLLERNKLEKEVENYTVFQNTILRDLLGFPEEVIEKGYNKKDVEFAFKDLEGQWSVLFEAKGTKTRDLFANQHRDKANQKTPVKQTYDNLTRFEFIKYGVCTNYQNFVLMDYNLKFSAFQQFDFQSTKNNDEKLKEFIGIFSYQSLVINKDISKFKTESDNADKELTTEFYKLFHETRLMLIKAFKEKQNVDQSEAVYYAQRFLERILFLFFAQDNGLIDNPKLFTERVLNQLKLRQCTEDSRKIFDDIKLLFKALDKGSKILGIHGFNGELFSGTTIPEKVYFLDFQTKAFFAKEKQNSKLSKELKLFGNSADIWKKFGENVNPIIRNLLIMDSRDFNSELNVTVLGHILEQSLDDLGEIQKIGDIKRKVEGVYYTPSTLTDYICRNTIIPYLSKSNVNDVHDLISEYQDDIEELEEKLEKIKIVDPACGSGAFLINATEILLEITEGLEKIKNDTKTQVSSGKLDDWQKEKETSKIIKNNIFGIDINRDAVQIAKLSLFLIMAKPGEKLTNLSQNIMVGDALIDDKDVYPNAFSWHEQFPDIMSNGGFDIVIGNPPWQGIKPDVDEFFSSRPEIQILLTNKFPKKKIPFSKLNAPQKKRFMDECLKKQNVRVSFDEYLNSYKEKMDYFGSPGKYALQGVGDINLYKLFIEKSLQIIQKDAIFGMVLPSGIYYDLGPKELRQVIFDKNSILELCGFVNKKPIFEDVHRQFKFCTFIFKKGGSTDKFLAKFFVLDDTELQNFRETAIEYNLEFIKRSSPNHLTILESSNKIEQQIFEKLFRFPTLEDPTCNFKVTQELHMTNDKNLFHTANVGPPLYEGKMIHMFKHTLRPPQYWLDKDKVEDKLKQKELRRIPAKIKKLNPNISLKLHAHEYRLVWRIQANSTDTRTLISTILPPNVFLGNSLGYFIPIIFENTTYIKPFSNTEMVFLCGMLNSFVQDFLMRHKMSRNINNFHINGQPIPRFDKNNLLHQKLFKNSMMLICTTDEYAKLSKEVGVSEYVTDSAKRMALEAQINACVAKIYGLTIEELEYVLESFSSEVKKLKDLTLDEFSLI